MNKLAISLETMSFFLVTFDLYYQSKPDGTPKILIQLSRLINRLVLPFVVLGIILVCTITITLLFAPNYRPFDFEKILSAIGLFVKYLIVIVLPLFFTVFIIAGLGSYYKENRKPIFILIGSVLFIVSKSLSFFSQ